MESVVVVLLFLVLFSTWMKMTFLKTWQLWAVSLICFLFVGLSWPWAINQSRNEIGEWLSNQPLMLDTSVVLCLEVLWQISYSLLAARLLYDGVVSSRMLWFYRILRFFPGILIFPVLFYALVQVVYAFPGQDFPLIAWSFAVLILAISPLLVYGIRRLLPEKHLRLELLFLLSVVVLALGVIATVNGTTTFHGSDKIEWNALGVFLLLSLICACLGLVIKQIQLKKFSK